MREWLKRAMTNPKAQAHKMRLPRQGQMDTADLEFVPIQWRVERQLLSQKCCTAAGDVGFVDFKEGLTLDAGDRFPPFSTFEFFPLA